MESGGKFLGTGMDTMPDPDMVWATEAEVLEIRRKRRLRAGVPSRFLDANLGNWQVSGEGDSYALGVAQFYVEKFIELRRRGSGMVFFGNAGTGKTRLGCTLVNELTDRGVDALYAKFPSILNRVRRSYNARSFSVEEAVESRESIIGDLVGYDLLILDEVARLGGGADESSLLYDLIDGRYEQSRPTIVVSNLNRADLITVMTERLVDRLADQRGAFVPFDWDSRRG